MENTATLMTEAQALAQVLAELKSNVEAEGDDFIREHWEIIQTCEGDICVQNCDPECGNGPVYRYAWFNDGEFTWDEEMTEM